MSSVNTCYFTSAIFMMKRISNCKEHIWESDRPALTTWYSFVSNPVANYSLFKKRGGGGGSFLSEGEEKKKKRRRINKYFTEGEPRGPEANPEQITGKQKQLEREYHCSKHTALTQPASALQLPALLFLNTLAKNRQNISHLFKKKRRGSIQVLLWDNLKRTLGFLC